MERLSALLKELKVAVTEFRQLPPRCDGHD
jgi:hypothetical protein